MPSMPDFGQMNGESVQGELSITPMQNNPEQDRRIKDLRSPKENDKFTEEPGEGCLTRIVVGRMAESVQRASSQATDVARPDEWIEDQSQKEI